MEVLATARASWPALPLPEATFLRYLAERLPREGSLMEALRALHAADLYFACACAQGLQAAHSALDTRFLPKVDAVVARVEGSGDGAAEVRQRLRERLLTSGAYRPHLRRSAGRRAHAEEETLAEGSVAGSNPELDYL